uniref:Uncharacterized protein n=1 Tax=Siphoviridae sp. ctNHj22 TaxID=2825468 RepID=A0A8S5VFY9_9CAUD|nr:MAG TPA: hypothetical protein [Siphoviridae sp. ctNHj22]
MQARDPGRRCILPMVWQASARDRTACAKKKTPPPKGQRQCVQNVRNQSKAIRSPYGKT